MILDILPGRLQQSRNTLPMHLPLQRRLKVLLPNMPGQYPTVMICLCIIVSNVVGLLLGNHACAYTTPSSWSAETVFAVAVGYQNGIKQALTFEQMHQGKHLCAGGVYLFI